LYENIKLNIVKLVDIKKDINWCFGCRSIHLSKTLN